jgi:acyl-CoA synthetase (AMP-forming)/AMP-acid ligase II
MQPFKTWAEIIPYYARTRPASTALVFEGRETDYAALQQQAGKLHGGLAALGLNPGDRVGYLALNRDDYFALAMGCAQGGFVLVGINWRLVAREIVYILQDSKVRCLFVGQEFLPVVERARAACPELERVIVLEQDYASWRDAAEALAMKNIQPEDVFLQLYTSGTTGFPKGALLTHAGILAAAANSSEVNADWSAWDDTDVSLVPMPVFHIGGTGWGLQALRVGGKAVVLAKPDIADMVASIERHKVTKMFAVPAVLNTILNHPSAAAADFSSVQQVLYGASPIPLDVLRRAISKFGCDFIQCYGATETSGTVVYLPPEDHSPEGTPRMASCGKAFPNIELKIIDDKGNMLPPRAVGEILIKGNSLMQGYHNRAEATASAIRDGWYYSGDAGYLDEDGYLYIYDRVKDMIVSGAENIYPAEVESALHEHAAVQDAAVIGVPDEKWGEAVKAIIVLKSGAAVTEAELIGFARERIAGYKVPKSIDFVTELPRNPSGKILKKDLRKPYWPENARQVG